MTLERKGDTRVVCVAVFMRLISCLNYEFALLRVRLVDVRNDAVWHGLLVLGPRSTILVRTFFFVTNLTCVVSLVW